MKSLVWIDPGVSTGIVHCALPDDAPMTVLGVWQVGGGVQGFLDWYWASFLAMAPNPLTQPSTTIGAEKFVPLAGQGFSQSLASTTPLLIEGALIALDLLPVYDGANTPRWQRASCQVLAGGKTPSERKKNTDNLLRRHGYWHTGKQIGKPDANDVNSAMKHALYYMTRTLKHRPTLETLYPEGANQ